jgi:hypothetical protein
MHIHLSIYDLWVSMVSCATELLDHYAYSMHRAMHRFDTHRSILRVSIGIDLYYVYRSRAVRVELCMELIIDLCIDRYLCISS